MPRRWVLGSAVVGAAIIIAVAVFSTTGLRHYRRLAAEAEALSAQNATLVKENTQLAEEVRRLKKDTAYIEKVARDELGHVHPGETTFLVPSQGTANP